MGEGKLHYVIAYDIRDPKRWRRAYRLIRGYGTRLQYSVFRCHLTARQFERLRWELEKRLATEDSLLFLGLCNGCVERVVARNRPESWDTADEEAPFKIL